MEPIQRLVDRAVGFLSLLAGALMLALTLVVGAAVVSRYFLQLPIRATTELSGLLFAWLVFLAAIAVTHNEDNIAVTYFRGKLPAVVQRLVDLFMKILMLAFSATLAWSSGLLALAVADQRMPVLQISSAWLNGALAVTFTGVALVLLLQVVLDLTKSNEQFAAEEERRRLEGLEGGIE